MTPAQMRKAGGGRLKCLGLVLLFMVGLVNVSGAADYPTKPIQMIVPFPPGGGTDVAARLVSGKLSDLLGQPVVVVNKTGGGGVIGVNAVLTAPADGYTILFSPAQLISAPLVRKGVTYDFLRDFAWVNMPMNAPTFFAVRKDAPWLTFEELVADAKKNPGKIVHGNVGVGSTGYFITEALKAETGADITQIPVDAEAGAISQLLGGHINVAIFQISAVGGTQLKAGSIRALALVDEKRHKGFPDMPTVVEKGFPNIVFSAGSLCGVRAGTPRAIVEKLEKIYHEALKDKKVIEKIERSGWVVENLGSKETREFIAKEYQRRLGVAKALNLIPK